MLIASAAIARSADAPFIPVGVATVDVTPDEPIRLTGYASRQTPSQGVKQKLWAKALAIGGDREAVVLITLDNCGIAEETYREIAKRLRTNGITQDRFTIACSHTHTGPATKHWAPNIFVKDLPPEQHEAINRYTAELVLKLEHVALAAMKDRQPGQLSWARGEVGFAKNRRAVRGSKIALADNEGGPVDHSLPVLKVTDANGKLRALVANYACHCTTLGGEVMHVCGDWAGYAQEAIERDHPGAVAMITIGCGADANPSPRGGADGGIQFAKQHGDALATEINRLLKFSFTPITGKLRTTVKEIELPFGQHFTKAQWLARSTNSGIVGYHAKKWLARLEKGEKLPQSLYYPITTWNFGDDIAFVFLPGEVVVDYALRLKRELDASRVWITGYANYVPCYIPSRRILAEGGYEAEDSLWYYDRPARISTNAEDLIVRTVEQLVPNTFRADAKKAEFPDSKTPAQALTTMRVPADMVVELVASEPLLQSPVAIDWDAQGRLWVCEMYDYPSGTDGRGRPGGVIKILSSSKGDGRYDTATVFLDGLAFPTGVMPWRKGALICAAPDILYAESLSGTGRANLIRTNITGFATHNFQARVNGFTWGLDGWVYGSSGLFGGKVRSRQTGTETDLSGRDFRYNPDTGVIEPVAGISQMGRVRDDFGEWFGNDNSTLLWHYPLADHYQRRNPNVSYPNPRVLLARNAEANKLFPSSHTLERFNNPESANRVTGACGPGLYRDELLGAGYYGNAFICEPVHNLVRRLSLQADGSTFAGHDTAHADRAEFLSSSDNWFRPVQARTGPDGALWIVDMYRFVIEHPRWIESNRLAQLDVRAGANMGRIYRVYPRGAKLRPIEDLTKLSPAALAARLDTPNGTTRDLVHRELLARGMQPEVEQLTRASHPAVRVQALAALTGGKQLRAETLRDGLQDPDPRVRRAALAISDPFLRANHPLVTAAALKLTTDSDPGVRYQVALSLGESGDPIVPVALNALAASGDRWQRAAVMTAISAHAAPMFTSLITKPELKVEDVAFGKALIQSSEDLAPVIDDVARQSFTNARERSFQFAATLLDTVERRGTRTEQTHALNVLAPALKLAARTAVDESAASETRAAAIALLARGPAGTNEVHLLTTLLQPAEEKPLRDAATTRLKQLRAPEVATELLRTWPRRSPVERSALLTVLLSRDEWAAMTLMAMAQGLVAPSELSLSDRKRLTAHKNSRLQQQATKLFPGETNTVRSTLVARYRSVNSLHGDSSRGKAVFEQQCATCHQLRGVGHAVGPNLAEYAGKSVGDFVLAILDPNAGVNPNYTAYTIEHRDGRSITGIITAETAGHVTIVQGGGVTETLLRRDIETIRASQLSLMPEGLEQAINHQAMADLIAWLKQGTGVAAR
jgi:putative membrane-bound dehydrogenase-like protein